MFVCPACAPPSPRGSGDDTPSAGLANGRMDFFVAASSSVKFARIVGGRAAATAAAWPPRDCNCLNVMNAYTGTLRCINRRLAGGAEDSGEWRHKSPPPSRLLKPSAKFHFEPVKQTGSITER